MTFFHTIFCDRKLRNYFNRFSPFQNRLYYRSKQYYLKSQIAIIDRKLSYKRPTYCFFVSPNKILRIDIRIVNKEHKFILKQFEAF